MSDIAGAEDDNQQIRLGMSDRLTGQTSVLWQLISPALQQLQPQQTESLRRVLVQLQILQQEQLSLTMPEIRFGF